MAGDVFIDDFRGNVLSTVECPFFHKHVHHHRQVFGIGKNSRVAPHTAHHGCALVVYMSVNQLLAVQQVVFCWRNVIQFIAFQGVIAYASQAHWSVENRINVGVEGFTG